jgi:tRNA A-37 threonylcarbamoyl transferase component Bud32
VNVAPRADDPSRALVTTVRVAVALAALFVGVHVLVARPTAYPAGAGFTLRTGGLVAPLADPQALRLTRPPDLSRPVDPVVAEVMARGPADVAGLRPGDRVLSIVDGRGARLDLAALSAADPAAALAGWRTAWWLDVRSPFTVTIERAGQPLSLAIVPRWFPDVAEGVAGPWLGRHLSGAVHIVGALLAAIALVALRVRGTVAALMTLTMIVNVAVGGALAGAEAWVPTFVREPLVLFSWLLAPLGFPVVALTVLNFPKPSALITRWPELVWALVALASPLLAANGLAALYLLGANAVAAPLTWFAVRPLLWPTTFVVAVLANAAIVIEGFGRYRRNPDANERRRIMVVVYTGVPGALAWAISETLPVAGTLLLGRPVQLPWGITVLLTAAMLLPAFGLPYAVAVKHVFSPRTVLRRSLQYALAQRTLTVLAALPAVPLLLSLVRQRDLSITEIVTGRPLFYAVGVGLLVLARRYREPAERWIDRRFFRAEYDAREIMMSLAGRMPFETDPSELVALVIHHVDSALHPESVAVLAEVAPGRFETVGARPDGVPPLPSNGGLATLLRWSREPFEVFLDDERSSVARLPADDRGWLAEAGVQLLVPLLAGNATEPTLVGLLALGPKQSDEPYAREDRALLAAIAAQMAMGLDVTRMRQRATAQPVTSLDTAPTLGGVEPTLGVCPRCHRCFELTLGTCSDDGSTLVPVPGLPAVVDGKYRIDAQAGRGGMGAVFKARDVRLDRDVAIKVVRADLLASPDARVRFRREAQIVARLQHPAVVAVFDYGTFADGSAYIVMEYVRGEDLRQRLRRTPALSPPEVVAIATGVAAGVQAAHDAGVFHRDLKPENVLLPENGGGPKVLDFGVAKLAPSAADPGGTVTAGATIVGTPAYMAPEQLRGEALDGRADVFSLGVMVFEMLTGRMPYGVGSFVDIGVKHASGRIADADRLPDALRPAVLQTLAADPDERPATPTAFAEALRAGGTD